MIRSMFRLGLACALALAASPGSAGETRPFTNALGSAEIPSAPRCIVSLHDLSITAQLFELGIVPCGSTGRRRLFGDTQFRGASGRFDTSGTRYIGTHQAPDIETIAALKPDLILGLSYHRPLVDRLSSIAPVVLLPLREEGITAYAGQLADLVNRKPRFEELRQEYLGLVEAFGRRVQDPASITVTPMEVYRDGFRIIGRSGMEQVIEDFGLGHVPAYDGRSPDVPLSLERLGDFDSDFIIDTYEDILDTEEETRQFRATAQWNDLFAVRNRQFLYLDRSRYGDTMEGLIGSATILLSHIGERDFVSQSGR